MMPYLNLLRELAQSFAVSLHGDRPNEWQVVLDDKVNGITAFRSEGSTPEEAIRKAYMAVNPLPRNSYAKT
jgi:hypothetical protein